MCTAGGTECVLQVVQSVYSRWCRVCTAGGAEQGIQALQEEVTGVSAALGMCILNM